MVEKRNAINCNDRHHLNGSLGFLINVAARSMRMALEEGLKSYGISPTQWIVMRGLGDKLEISQTDLSCLLFLDNATITRQIDRLEQMGLIRRRRHSDDRRVQLVSLTPRGKRLLPKCDEIADKANEAAIHGMNKRDVEKMLSGLIKIQANLGINGD